ncbi:hypothetical protein DFJ73DRAFT_827113 [Zopfochytrium polystomum]|nr:hypothetical protein DFJ73DRAFT_827113 [Zopfochytrium polystomum]
MSSERLPQVTPAPGKSSSSSSGVCIQPEATLSSLEAAASHAYRWKQSIFAPGSSTKPANHPKKLKPLEQPFPKPPKAFSYDGPATPKIPPIPSAPPQSGYAASHPQLPTVLIRPTSSTSSLTTLAARSNSVTTARPNSRPSSTSEEPSLVLAASDELAETTPHSGSSSAAEKSGRCSKKEVVLRHLDGVRQNLSVPSNAVLVEFIASRLSPSGKRRAGSDLSAIGSKMRKGDQPLRKYGIYTLAAVRRNESAVRNRDEHTVAELKPTRLDCAALRGRTVEELFGDGSVVVFIRLEC